jgi:hypothetical protein
MTPTVCVATISSQVSAIIRTDDQGTSWHYVETTRRVINGVSCGSPTTCVAVGDATWVSTSAGSRWTIHPSSYFLSDTCTSATRCWALGFGPQQYAPAYVQGGVFETSDAGSSWSLRGTPGANPVALACTPLVCHEISNYLYWSSSLVESALYTGIVGGNAWAQWPDQVPDSAFALTALCVTPEGRWIAVGGNVVNGPAIVSSP